MRIINDIGPISFERCSVVTIGTYDGIHAGHKSVLDKLVEAAKSNNCQSVVVTFYPHPRFVLYPEQKDLKLIDTEEEKLEKFIEMGIDVLVVIPFSKDFAATPYAEFVENVLVKKLRIKKFILGRDHKFGKQREGNLQALLALGDKYNFSIEYVTTTEYDGQEISSTKIRKAIAAGTVDTAGYMLGSFFSVRAKVISGQKIGQKIGFPTANLLVEHPDKLIPGEGVYAVKVKHNNTLYKGMLNIGKNPTASHDDKLKIEVHIFDFHKNIYNDTIQVYFVKRIRNEMKFNSFDLLQKQLFEDKKTAETLLD